MLAWRQRGEEGMSSALVNCRSVEKRGGITPASVLQVLRGPEEQSRGGLHHARGRPGVGQRAVQQPRAPGGLCAAVHRACAHAHVRADAARAGGRRREGSCASWQCRWELTNLCRLLCTTSSKFVGTSCGNSVGMTCGHVDPDTACDQAASQTAVTQKRSGASEWWTCSMRYTPTSMACLMSRS